MVIVSSSSAPTCAISDDTSTIGAGAAGRALKAAVASATSLCRAVARATTADGDPSLAGADSTSLAYDVHAALTASSTTPESVDAVVLATGGGNVDLVVGTLAVAVVVVKRSGTHCGATGRCTGAWLIAGSGSRTGGNGDHQAGDHDCSQ